MKKLFVILGLVVAAAAFYWTRAECAWCPTYKCFGSCSGSCRCMSQDYSGGVCVSIERMEAFEAQGYKEIK